MWTGRLTTPAHSAAGAWSTGRQAVAGTHGNPARRLPAHAGHRVLAALRVEPGVHCGHEGRVGGGVGDRRAGGYLGVLDVHPVPGGLQLLQAGHVRAVDEGRVAVVTLGELRRLLAQVLPDQNDVALVVRVV